MRESIATLIPIIAFLVFGVLINFQKVFSEEYKGYKKLRGWGKCQLCYRL